nr:RNA-directed DNA polymerase, eukaryota [Tanacetum cinerariifolium]
MSLRLSGLVTLGVSGFKVLSARPKLPSCQVVDEGLFKGIFLPNSIFISHLFYADDAMFLGEWSDGNLQCIINLLKSFFLASGLQINIFKSQLLGVGVPRSVVEQSASSIGCSILSNQFRYLGVMVKTLSIGGRLTLLKSVLGASPIYNMSIFKRIGNGINTRFWSDCWIGDLPLYAKFPQLYALELDKDASVAVKLSAHVDISFRRRARGGLEQHLMAEMQSMLDLISLSNSSDRWFCDLSSDGIFRVKEVRNFIDDLFLPSHPDSTRWVKSIPIKINIFTWRARRDCLPTRANLVRRGVRLESPLCPIPKGGPRSRSDKLGFLRSDSHPRLNLYWRVFFGCLVVDLEVQESDHL